MTQQDLKCPPLQGFAVYLLLSSSSAFAHCCSTKKEGLRLCRAHRASWGLMLSRAALMRGANGHSTGVPTAGLALEDLELLTPGWLDCTPRRAKEDAHGICTTDGVSVLPLCRQRGRWVEFPGSHKVQ